VAAAVLLWRLTRWGGGGGVVGGGGGGVHEADLGWRGRLETLTGARSRSFDHAMLRCSLPSADRHVAGCLDEEHRDARSRNYTLRPVWLGRVVCASCAVRRCGPKAAASALLPMIRPPARAGAEAESVPWRWSCREQQDASSMARCCSTIAPKRVRLAAAGEDGQAISTALRGE